MKKLLISVLALTLLTGCVTAIPSAEMMPNPRTYTYISSDRLAKNVALGDISLSKQMPSSGLIVTATEFDKVLAQSLEQAGWLSQSPNSAYILHAYFIKQDIPFSMFNTKITSVVDYTLLERKTGRTVYQQQVVIPCIVKFLDEMNADLRVLKARKCSVGENVTHLLRDLNNRF